MRLSILAAVLALAVMPFTSAAAEEDMAGESMGMTECSAESNMAGGMHEMVPSGTMMDQMDGMMGSPMDDGMMSGAVEGTMQMGEMYEMMSCSMPAPDMTPMSPGGM